MNWPAALQFRELPPIRLSVAAAFLTGTILLAGAIHICAILLVPMFAEADGWSRIEPFAGDHEFTEVPTSHPGSESVAGLDPLFVNGACRMDLAETPAGITVEAGDRFWSLALYDPTGTIIFSLNDRTAVGRQLDMIVVNPDQNARLQETASAELESKIVVESLSDDLIALLRLFAPTASARRDAQRMLAQAECLTEPEILPSPPSA